MTGQLRQSLIITSLVLMSIACMQFAYAASVQQIRVVIDDSNKSARIKGELQWRTASEELAGSSDPSEVVVSGGRLSATINGSSYTSARLIATPTNGYVQYSGKGYRGRIELFIGQNGNIVVLNVLPLEEYLYGVVPSEMSPSWPEEALKTQAVAARTYALSRISANSHKSYDVYGTVADQAYSGLGGEHQITNRIVDATAGKVITYGSEIITAFYSACAGGFTKQGNAPYLRSVYSHHEDSPHADWECNLSLEKLSSIVKGTGADIGPIRDVSVEYDAVSGHLLSMIVHGSNDSKQLYGTTLRKLVGRSSMKSTRARIFPVGSNPQPLIAKAPPSSAPETTEAQVLVTEIVLPGEEVIENDPTTGFITKRAYGWIKPWVADDNEHRMRKMRELYAFDGSSLMQCNREMHMLAGENDAGGNPFQVKTSESSSSLFTPEPLPERKIVMTRHSRSDLSAGFVIRGDGYGHGIGMSQWGARALAEQGMDYRKIITYFYYGVEIIQWSGGNLNPGDPLNPSREISITDNSFTSVQLD